MSSQEEIKKLRELINLNDQSLLQTLATRFQITKQVGLIKKQNSLPIENTQREETLRSFWLEEAKKYQLDASFTNSLLDLILKESKRRQNSEN